MTLHIQRISSHILHRRRTAMHDCTVRPGLYPIARMMSSAVSIAALDCSKLVWMLRSRILRLVGVDLVLRSVALVEAGFWMEFQGGGGLHCEDEGCEEESGEVNVFREQFGRFVASLYVRRKERSKV